MNLYEKPGVRQKADENRPRNRPVDFEVGKLSCGGVAGDVV